MKYNFKLLSMLLICTLLVSLMQLGAENTIKASTVYWVANTGNDNNPGTETSPFRTIQKGADVAVAGDTIKIKPGTYTEQVIVKNSGTVSAPITFESVTRWGAIINNPTSMQFKYDKAGIHYITLRGIQFKDAPVASPNLYYGAAVMALKGWRIEYCYFFNNSVCINLQENREGNGCDCDDVTIENCVFSDTTGMPFFMYGDKDNYRIKNLSFKNNIIRRSNSLNYDSGWATGGGKFVHSENAVVDNIGSYDNNGSGLWFDIDNYNMTVKNSTFFGNHAGWQYENFTTGNLSNQWWSANGLMIEISHGYNVQNNTFYSNLSNGLCIWESGENDAPNYILYNKFVDNDSCVEYRAIDRPGYDKLGGSTLMNNLFKSWRSDLGAWRLSPDDTSQTTVTATNPYGHGISINNNNYDNTLGKPLAKWEGILASNMSTIQNTFYSESNGTQNATSFAGPLVTVHATSLSDVGQPSMWQVPSSNAEANNIDAAIVSKNVGQTVTIPVSWRYKEFTQSGSDWYVDVYDLQARKVKLKMTAAGKTWIEANVKDYVSTSQTNVSVTLTAKSAYNVEATYNESSPTPYMLNDTAASNISYTSGSWAYSSNRGYGDYNNDLHVNTTYNGYCTISFYGKKIDIITPKASWAGWVRLYFDGSGTPNANLNLYYNGYLPQQVIYTKDFGTVGNHTVTMQMGTGNNPLDGGTYMCLDAVNIYQ